MDRRTLLRSLASTVAGTAALDPARVFSTLPLRPPRLRTGDTVGLINPAGATFQRSDIDVVRETLAGLGLSVRPGLHVLDRYGYLAGSDADRAGDVHAMFLDPEVRMILAVRGGWGCARILPLLDFDLIRRHPRIVMGYSDITALLVAITARTGLVTMHGPVGTSTWNAFSVDLVRRVLFEGEAVVLRNPGKEAGQLAQTADRVQTITPGVARGTLVGGNLSVLAGLVGSEYLPEWKGKILFLEDDGEQIYRVDRMLTQLRLAGILDRLAGFVFGKCTNCGPGEGYGSLTLEEVLQDHIGRLGIPAWSGAMIGHIEKKFTVPLGINAEIDASAGTITLLEPCVQ